MYSTILTQCTQNQTNCFLALVYLDSLKTINDTTTLKKMVSLHNLTVFVLIFKKYPKYYGPPEGKPAVHILVQCTLLLVERQMQHQT